MCLLSGVDRFDTVFQWAIAFNSPVSVIRGGEGLGLESGDLTKEVSQW